MIKLLFISAIKCFGDNPVAGATGAGGGFGLGYLIKIFTPETMELISYVLQNLAFIGAILVSTLTIIGWIQKQRKNKSIIKKDEKSN